VSYNIATVFHTVLCLCVTFVAVVYHNYNEVVEPIIQLFSIITSQLLCYLSEVCAGWW